MSAERDPDRDQVAPVHNDQPSCHDLVIEDMRERKQFGLKKYSTELQPFNGRSFLQDAYEEVLDLAVYLRGKLEEERQLAAGVFDLQDTTEPLKLRTPEYDDRLGPIARFLAGRKKS